MNLRITSRETDGVRILDLSGRIVLGQECTTLRETLKGLADRGEKKVLLNLADVNYVDSSGLGTLASGYLAIANREGKLKLLKLTKRIQDLMVLTNVIKVFEVFDDEAAALKSFHS
jgi:anti-sigma B factor antagonist